MNETAGKIISMVSVILAEALLLFCGAFFASTETAYTSLSRITVRQMLKENKKNAKKISVLKNNLDSLISTVLIGTNLVTSLISAIATAFTTNYLGAQYVTYGTAVVSMLVIIFSEIIPKTYAAVCPEITASGSANAITVLQKIFFPVVWCFNQFSRFLNFLEKKLVKSKKPLLTEDELKTLIDVGETEGTLESDEKEMLYRLFEFSDLTVHTIMRHRSLVKSVSVNATLEEVIKAFADSGYSRLPVYENDCENIIGVVHYKAVVFASKPVTQSRDFLRICMRPADFIPETFTAIELLQHFKKVKNNFAVAVNEYGGLAGIVTMDDILRAVFGRITDEYGAVETAPEKRIQVISTNEFLIPGDMKLDDVNDVLNLNLDSSNFDTIGGWLLEKFDELPSIGAVYRQNIPEGSSIFIVEDQSARRIQSVRLKFVW